MHSCQYFSLINQWQYSWWKLSIREVLSGTSNMALSKLNLSNSNNDAPISKVDVGFGLKQQLKELRSSGKINYRQKYQFKSEAFKVFVALCTHMKKKSPLSPYFTR